MRMRGRLAIALVTLLATLVLRPAPAPAQGGGPCVHQGRPVQCPQGLPPGSQSVAFVPGGTNWRNSATGAVVFVPSTTFPPFVASPTPTAPPGPTTGPGPTAPTGPTSPTAPGQPPGGPGITFPLTPQGQIYLTQPSTHEVGDPLAPGTETGQKIRKGLAEAELKEAKAATEAAIAAGQTVLKDLAAQGVAGGVLDPEGIRTKERTRWVSPKLRQMVIRITPQFRAAFGAYEKAIEENKRTPTPANQEKVLEAGRALDAAADAAPVDQAATERLQKAAGDIGRAYEAEERAQADLDAASGKPPAAKAGADVQKPGADVQKSDVEKAPTFEPDDKGKVDDVM
jgi:hypothetical protein